MIATVIPDIALIIVGILAFIGVNISFNSSHPLNLYLHSIFPILLFIPFAICCREYFYSLTMGYPDVKYKHIPARKPLIVQWL